MESNQEEQNLAVEDDDELFISFENIDDDIFEQTNPIAKKKTTRRRTSFGIARAAINSKKRRLSRNKNLIKSKSLELPVEKMENKLASKSVTLPISPNLRINKRLGTASRQQVAVKSEQMLMEKLEQEREKARSTILRAKKMYQRLKKNGFHMKSTSASVCKKKPTIPVAPKSVLDVRLGKRVTSAPVEAPVVKKSISAPAGGITIPQPFQFATEKRISTETKEKTLTGGEYAEKFNRISRTYANSAKTTTLKTTVPVSPKLKTDIRAKTNKSVHEKPMSRDEEEEKLLEEQKKFVFKARPLDKRIFESRGEFGVPKVTPKPPTVPVDIHLRTEKRATSPRVRTRELETVAEKVVAPQQRRATTANIMEHNDIEKPKERRLTQPVEFHFATAVRGEKYRAAFNEQVEKERVLEQEKAHQMLKPHPVPNFNRITLPKRVPSKESTIPEPFSLESIVLHEESLAEFQREVEEERRREKAAAEVKALNVPKTLYEPQTIATESNKPATIPLDIRLESDNRAIKRQLYDQKLQAKMEANDRLVMEKEKQLEDQENQVLQTIRRKSVEEGGLMFKAKPILKEDLYPVKSTMKPFEPTIPRSPKFALTERKGSKLNQQPETSNARVSIRGL